MLVDLLALDQVGLAGIVDLDLLQHLANDHLDVLVVDRHALQPVDLLDLVDEVGGELLDALDRQDVVRRRIAVDDVVALLDRRRRPADGCACPSGSGTPRGSSSFVGRLDRDAALVLVVLAEPHRAGDFGDDRALPSDGAPRTAPPPAADRR